MRIGVLGTGSVGKTIGTKLVELGHEVTIGSRAPDNEEARSWASRAGERGSHGTFADAASDGELLFNCTAGSASLAALGSAGADALGGKVLIDVANPLDFSAGGPPTLTVCNEDSLAERIQRAYPEARVVKALNTVNADVMVSPGKLPGRHDVFVCGDDAAAKDEVAALLEAFGWPPDAIVDLGDTSAARGTEMYLALWLRVMQALGTPRFNVAVVR